LTPARMSIKLLIEFPITVAMMIQTFRDYNTPAHISKLVPVFVRAITIQPQQQRLAHESANTNNTIQIGMSANITNKASYNDLKSLQVKTLSFIAYISKNHPDIVKQYQEIVTSSLMLIMQDCPTDAYTTRKVL